MTRVRLAGADDVLQIVDWVEDLRLAVDGLMSVSRPWTAAAIASLIQNPDAVVMVSGAGFIAGSLQPTIINPARVALEHGWYARDRSGVHLLRAFEAWAADRGAEMVRMSTGAVGPDLSRLGYRLTEKSWVKKV